MASKRKQALNVRTETPSPSSEQLSGDEDQEATVDAEATHAETLTNLTHFVIKDQGVHIGALNVGDLGKHKLFLIFI